MASNDMLGTLKGLLGEDADKKIGAIMSALSSSKEKTQEVLKDVNNDIELNGGETSGTRVFNGNSDNGFNSNNFLSPDGVEFIGRIKSMVDEMGMANDSRSNLLMSLKPYMRETRKKSIDNAIKILNLSRMSGIFKI